jgi:hypothetical protein
MLFVPCGSFDYSSREQPERQDMEALKLVAQQVSESPGV